MAEPSNENLESLATALADLDIEKEDAERAQRLSEEWLKVERALDKAGIFNTIVFFGSARIEDRRESELMSDKANELAASHQKRLHKKELSPEPSEQLLVDKALSNANLAIAQSRFYEEARELAHRIAKHLFDCNDPHTCLVTGGGPGIMEAANRGASEVGQQSVGLNITIPAEQKPNPYITNELSFEFRYFSLRKMHFLKRAKAIVVFPGGFGTLDELLEVLTLIQTRKIQPIPIVLYGADYWERVVDFRYLAEQQYIDTADLAYFTVCDDISHAFKHLLTCLSCDLAQ